MGVSERLSVREDLQVSQFRLNNKAMFHLIPFYVVNILDLYSKSFVSINVNLLDL